MSITEKLGLSGDFSALATDTASFIGSSRFHSFEIDKPVRYMASLGDQEVEASTTLKAGGALMRLSLVERTNAAGNYFMINGTCNRIKLVNTVVVDGVEYSLAEFFLQLVNEGIEDPAKRVELDRFLQIVGKYGWDIDNRNRGMGLNFMHFRADTAKAEDIFTWFEQQGAKDVTDTIANKNGIVKVLAFDKGEPGVPLTQFRSSKMDRSLTQNGTGFVSFVDAAYENFVRFLSKRAEAKVMQAELDAAIEKGSVTPEAILVAKEEIDKVSKAATSWMGTWGGVSNRLTPDEAGKPVATNTYDTVQVPIGTLTAGGKELDFWTNSPNGWTPIAAGNVASAADPQTTEEPF